MLRNDYCAGEWVLRRCGTLLGHEVTIVYGPCNRVIRGRELIVSEPRAVGLGCQAVPGDEEQE